MMGKRYGLIVVRAAFGLVLVATLAYRYPELIHSMTIPFVRVLNAVSFPYLSDLRFDCSGKTVDIAGTVDIAMTLQGGAYLPKTSASLSKTGSEMLNAFVLTFVVWLARPGSLRRRFAALPVAFVGALLACGIFLELEIQHAALSGLGRETMASLPLEATASNIAYFARMERHFEVVRWLKSFLEGGGMLFLAVLAGLAGYAVSPGWMRRRKAGEHKLSINQ